MKHTSKNFSLLLLSLICTLTLFACLGYFLHTILRAAGEADTILQSVDEALAQSGQESSLKKTMAATLEDQQKLESYFVSEVSIVNFLETIENLGGPSGTTVKLVSANLNKETKAVDVDVSATGSFSNVYRFLSLLEEIPYVIVIHKVNFLKRDGGEGASYVWEADIAFTLTSFLPK